MNSDNRVKVEKYLEDKDCSPLKFVDYHRETLNTKLSTVISLEDLITDILNIMYDNYSVNVETNNIETYPYKWRSVLDIWRHIKYLRPEVTIFEVMSSMFDMGEDLLRGQYCHSVCRRTFLPENRVPGAELMSQDEEDEFGLTFYEWEDI